MSCDVTQEVNSTSVDVDCSLTSLLLPAHSQVQQVINSVYFTLKAAAGQKHNQVQ